MHRKCARRRVTKDRHVCGWIFVTKLKQKLVERFWIIYRCVTYLSHAGQSRSQGVLHCNSYNYSLSFSIVLFNWYPTVGFLLLDMLAVRGTTNCNTDRNTDGILKLYHRIGAARGQTSHTCLCHLKVNESYTSLTLISYF